VHYFFGVCQLVLRSEALVHEMQRVKLEVLTLVESGTGETVEHEAGAPRKRVRCQGSTSRGSEYLSAAMFCSGFFAV
jgi:hypothetical protein